MSNTEPDRLIVQAHLREISLLLGDLERLGDVDAGRLHDDRFTRHVAERVLSQVVELATSINTHRVADVRWAVPRAARRGCSSSPPGRLRPPHSRCAP